MSIRTNSPNTINQFINGNDMIDCSYIKHNRVFVSSRILHYKTLSGYFSVVVCCVRVSAVYVCVSFHSFAPNSLHRLLLLMTLCAVVCHFKLVFDDEHSVENVRNNVLNVVHALLDSVIKTRVMWIRKSKMCSDLFNFGN